MNHIRSIVIAILASIICQWIISSSAAQCAGTEADLYRVYIHSQRDADLLASQLVDPLIRLSDGYLVLVPPDASDRLKSTGLRCDLIASGVDRKSLARDRRPNLPDAGSYEVIFQEGATRLCRADRAQLADKKVAARFLPVGGRRIPIVYRAPLRLDKSVSVPPEDLDSLVARVSEDSAISYSEFLQSLNGRRTMTSGAQFARNWLVAKFREYGYDSVVTDTFTEQSSHGNGMIHGHNVMAYKIGTVNPYHKVVIGAHYDTPVDIHGEGLSPGADDNGSGTVGVMEIARALSDVDTRQTFVFILFDSEEEGLLGSYAFAERAFENNDRISLMLNMDMIGNYENDSDAYLYWGTDSTFADLWTSVAESTAGINLIGHGIAGNLSSDDISFTNFGYHSLAEFEYIESAVMHTYHDSTTYLNFDYLTRMARATLVTACVFDQQFVPDYEIWMTFATPASEFVVPNRENAVDVLLREYGGAQLIPSSVSLHYAVNDGEPQSSTVENVGGDLYRGYLPALPCLDKIAYYITAEDDSLGTVYLPADSQPIVAYVTTGTVDIFYDDFGTDKGWTVTGNAVEGQWQRSSDLIGWGMPDHDYDGNGMCYVTDTAIFHDVDQGTTSLISPVVDASAGAVFVEYARWYSNNTGPAPNSDVFKVFLSSNGGVSWYPIETLGPVDQASGEWGVNRVLVSNYINPSSQVRIRFDASDLGEDSNVDAAVDAVRFSTLSTDLHILTESVPNWTAYHPYSQQLDAAVCEGQVTWTDMLGQLDGTGLTLSSDGLLSGVPTRLGPIVFRAQAVDQFGGYDQQILSFIIYDTLHVTTAAIPSASLDIKYLSQLKVSGGTGTKTWSDRDSDLDGTGVTLSESGLLSGAPTAEGDFPFTALVTDQVGATAEKGFMLHVVGPYVCGDADGDGMVNVGDAVYVINYVFKGGAPPDPIEAGDANADGAVNVADAVYLINFIFKGGPAPECP